MSDTATASGETATNSDRSLPAPGAIAGLFALYLLTIIGGVALSGPFETAGVQTFENPGNVANVGLIFAEIAIVTALFILITRYGYGMRVLRVLVLGVFGYATYLAVFGSGLPAAEILGVALGIGVFITLFVHPEWYVIDAVAVIAGAAIVAQFGNGLGPLPALVFLLGMAAYDAYAVYVSEHMQQLGSGVGELKLPLMYVVPPTRSFSMADMGDPFEAEADDMDDSQDPDGGGSTPEESGGDASENSAQNSGRETPLLLGLGDAIVPGLLAVSAGQFLPADPLIAGTILNAPALGAIIGSAVGLAGLLGLLYMIERAHAGLPVLNTCVILGYLAGGVVAGVPITTALGVPGF
jgi:presenilin-like A22 family membrane protease